MGYLYETLEHTQSPLHLKFLVCVFVCFFQLVVVLVHAKIFDSAAPFL